MNETLPSTLASIADKQWQALTDSVDSKVLDQARDWLYPVLGLSDFVARTLVQQPELIPWLHDERRHAIDYRHSIAEPLSHIGNEEQMMRTLRRFRHAQMTRIAVLDLLNEQTIEESLVQVSDLADALINAAYHWVYHQLAQRYGVPMANGEAQSMLIVGMGKLGGKELNFSSDIDLIFCYPELGETQGGERDIENQRFFTKLGQKVITALNHVTADGQVFRVDMRLRPFGESGPLVVHFSALEDYYQEQGREWERYAMVKARVINQSNPFTEELHRILRPFVYRRYIDYSAIEALRNMKRLIRKEVRRRGLQNNIKLGPGGIREVEFIAQTFQLIRGGREPQLQTPPLMTVLTALNTLEVLPEQEVRELKRSYTLLRKVEHCLQQFNDEQTQTLPDDDIDQQRLAWVFNQSNYAAVEQQIKQTMDTVAPYFNDLIGDDEDDELEGHGDWQDLWELNLTDDEAVRMLSEVLSDDEAPTFWRALKDYAEQQEQRAMGKRGRETLDKLMPSLIANVLERDARSPSALLASVLGVIQSISKRTAYLELLRENPGALYQLVRLCDASEWIANQIRHFPILLDELLNPQQLYELNQPEAYNSELRAYMLRVPEDDLEAQMEGLRQFKLSQQLKVAAADITGVLPVMKVSDHLTNLAEAMVAEVVQEAWQQMTARYGYPAGMSDLNTGFGVVAYGKMGGIELGYGSDLDLVFVHNCDSNADTDGPKAIESRQFYIKLAQRIMHLFTTKTASGDLYDIDLRLRPSGSSGLLVCHIDGFEEYQLNDAWTWEHQALTRSRFIFGDDRVCETFERIRQSVMRLHRDWSQLRADVIAMRQKMRQHLRGNEPGFHLKQDPGGVADIEFLVQYWVLSEAQQHAQLCRYSDNVRQLEQLAAVAVIDESTQALLTEAYLTYRNAGHHYTLANRASVAIGDEFEPLRQQVIDVWQRVFPEDKAD